MDIRVLGAGVSGLTSALCLLRAGHRVEVWFAEPPSATTSAVAAAIWFPYKIDPPEKVRRWASESRSVFEELAAFPESGVLLREGEVVSGDVPDELAKEITADSGRLCLPVVDMSVYLQYLENCIRDHGGNLVQRRASSVSEALDGVASLVNCTGLGARELVGDQEIYPIRGQVVRVAREQVERFVIDDDNPAGVTYVIPRIDDCVLGGTADEGDSSLAINPAVSEGILDRSIALVPALAQARRLGAAVGLRPGRSQVRLESEWFGLSDGNRKPVIHNYGHGGAGVTVSWGCAREVVQQLATRDDGPSGDSESNSRAFS